MFLGRPRRRGSARGQGRPVRPARPGPGAEAGIPEVEGLQRAAQARRMSRAVRASEGRAAHLLQQRPDPGFGQLAVPRSRPRARRGAPGAPGIQLPGRLEDPQQHPAAAVGRRLGGGAPPRGPDGARSQSTPGSSRTAAGRPGSTRRSRTCWSCRWRARRSRPAPYGRRISSRRPQWPAAAPGGNRRRPRPSTSRPVGIRQPSR